MKQIPLTQGQFAIVDDEDFELLNQWKWQALKHGHSYYAARFIKKSNGLPKQQMIIQMHRFINNTPKGMDTDHINGDKLDNRKANLRTCTRSQNMMNARNLSRNTSGYRGVHWKKREKKWETELMVNQKKVYLGSYINIIDAAKAYNEGAIKHFGEYAVLNSFNE